VTVDEEIFGDELRRSAECVNSINLDEQLVHVTPLGISVVSKAIQDLPDHSRASK
jgi:hypothetical protein